LHVTVIQTKGRGGVLPEFPGIEDASFITGSAPGKGMITKREVRLAILSLIQPSNNDVIWDIGAGCGSVAVELAYWRETAQIYAIEHHPARLECLAQNKSRFGVVGNLKVIEGRAPDCLAELPPANKVFIGGSDGEMAQLLAVSWQQLPEGGLLVASCVTENSKMQLIQFADQLATSQVETLQIAVSKGTTLAGQLMYKPNLPVTLFKFSKS
ncbi:MAG: precorrin-6Y C5,15-methyltransferase (decarboxylating) subunit CbiT, partial [Psychrosphaera sp.]|nr:precorrin-6Y C5,15-methyltransferase (decarboxylating) subunit CbiT [Psychrosphaera sp.]